MKKIYFVRHGQSAGNISLTKVGPDPELTEQGVRQARAVADRFMHIPVDVIISSPLSRARSTAAEISEKIGVSVSFDDLVMEWKQPAAMTGVPKSECPKMIEMVDDDFAVSGVFPNGESFSELKERALSARMMLERRREERILVVSHDVFLHMLVSCVVFGKEMTHDHFAAIYECLKASNTGITVFGVDETKPIGEQWALLTWNDDRHI